MNPVRSLPVGRSQRYELETHFTTSLYESITYQL